MVNSAATVTIAPDGRWRRAFIPLWLVATLAIGWLLLNGSRQFDLAKTGPTVLLMLVCVVGLLRWLPDHRLVVQAGRVATQRGLFALNSLILLIVLFAARDIFGPPLLFGFPVAAVAVLAVLRPRLDRRAISYAVLLGVAAALAALALGSAKFPPAVWAGLQIALVIPCLLAGWTLLARTGLLQAGFGGSAFLSSGWRPAVIAAVQGAIIGVPWAMLNVAMGGTANDTWVTSWWRPLAAIQPGIAEEAWGRVFLVPLLFVVLRRVAQERTALTAAVFIAAYWFAYLHTPGGMSVSSLFSTLLIGTLFSLPVSYLWLRRDLETAMGFHFWQDFFRFAFALLVNAGFIV